MLIILIGALLIVLGVFLFRHEFEHFYDVGIYTGIAAIIIGAVAVIIFGGGSICAQITKDEYIYKNEQRYIALTEKVKLYKEDENNMLDAHSNLLKEVADWNADMYTLKKWSKSPWTNWFTPDVSGNTDYIDLNDLLK